MLDLVPERGLQVLAQGEHQTDRVLGEGLVEDVPRVGEHDVARGELGEEHALDAGGARVDPAKPGEAAPVLAKVAAADVPDQQRVGVGGLRRRRRRRIDEDVSNIRPRIQDVATWWIALDHSDEEGHIACPTGSERLAGTGLACRSPAAS